MVFRLGKTVFRLREIVFRVAEMVLAVDGPSYSVFAATSAASSQFKPKEWSAATIH